MTPDQSFKLKKTNMNRFWLIIGMLIDGFHEFMMWVGLIIMVALGIVTFTTAPLLSLALWISTAFIIYLRKTKQIS